jgi:hypothetical protein
MAIYMASLLRSTLGVLRSMELIRFVMEGAQIKAILNFCKSRKLSCIDGGQAVNSEEDFHDLSTTRRKERKSSVFTSVNDC